MTIPEINKDVTSNMNLHPNEIQKKMQPRANKERIKLHTTYPVSERIQEG